RRRPRIVSQWRGRHRAMPVVRPRPHRVQGRRQLRECVRHLLPIERLPQGKPSPLHAEMAAGRRAGGRGRAAAAGNPGAVELAGITMTAPIDTFFYGLYMDESVLAGAGVTARNGRKARADGFALKIGQRATLVKETGGVVWGMVFALTEAEL